MPIYYGGLRTLLSNLPRRRRPPARGAALAVERLEDRTVYAADPFVSITAAEADPFIGTQVQFQVSFDNRSPSDVGYGPYINLILPATGADGAGSSVDDGVTFLNATYLGVALNTTVLTFNGAGQAFHPYAVDAAGQPVVITGNPGDQLVVIELPFGSFTGSQPPADVIVTAQLSNLADVSKPLTIQATGGFRYGNDEFSNPAVDPTIQQATPSTTQINPQLIRLTKTYLGPESETATGPNYVRRYRLDVEVAPGQTITNLDISDLLPDNMQFVSVVDTQIDGVSVSTASVSTPGATTPGGVLTRRFASVTGTNDGNPDATVIFEYYIPRLDADGDVIIDPTSGDDVPSPNNASATGTWNPLDGRDPLDGQDLVVAVNVNEPGPEHVLTDKSIAIQKSHELVVGGVPTGEPAGRPGDVVEYTLEIQVSDYFAFENVEVDDLLSDGQRIDESFTPTITIREHGQVYTYTFVDGTWTFDVLGDGTLTNTTPNEGSTAIHFDISGLMEDAGFIAANGNVNSNLVGGALLSETGTNAPLTGAGAPPLPWGATTVTIKYRAIIQDRFTDQAPSGETALNSRDALDNQVVVKGDVLDVTTLTPTGQSESDDSGEGIVIVEGRLEKTIYAINGQAPVRAATTAAIGGVYNPVGGASGTGTFAGAPLAIDGVTLQVGDRVLVKNQGDARQNGIYVVTGAGTWERAADFDAHAEVKSHIVVVLEGDANEQTYFRQTTSTGTLNVTPIVYSQEARPVVTPGDTVTYRLKYTLPTGDVEQLRLTDFLPLPIFFAVDPDNDGAPNAWTFNTGTSALPPAAGTATYLPTNTFDAIYSPTASFYANVGTGAPTITADGVGNSLNFNFGTYIDTANAPRTLDFVFTVEASDRPFTDGLYLTNQVQSSERSTQQPAVEITQNAIIQVQVGEPVVDVYKGVVGSTRTGGQTIGGLAFTAPGGATGFSSGALTTPEQAALIGAVDLLAGNLPDAGDRVKFAIVAQNTGRSDAFDVKLADALDPQYFSSYADKDAFVAGTNLKVQRGDGTLLVEGTDYVLTWNDATNTFVVELTDAFVTSDDKSGGLNRGRTGDGVLTADGSNAIVVTFEATLVDDVEAGVHAPNTSPLVNYSSVDGGTDFTEEDPFDDADVATRTPTIDKTLVGTPVDGNNTSPRAVIGEVATYRVTLTIPEGRTLEAALADALPTGLSFIGITSVTVVGLDSGALTFNPNGTALAFDAANVIAHTTVADGGRSVTIDLGTITNTDDDLGDETIVIEYTARVLDVMSNQSGTTLANTATLSYSTGSTSDTSENLTVVEPTLTIGKTVDQATADAGNVLTYTITIGNSSGYHAYDATFRDSISPFLTGATLVSVTTTGFGAAGFPAPTLADFMISGGVIQLDPTGPLGGDLDVPDGATIVLRFSATVVSSIQGGQQITNTAIVDWTSLDGAVAGERTGAGDPTPDSTTPDAAILDNYAVASSVATTGVPIGATKTIVTTSRTETTGNNVTLGEIVTYRITVTLPEGDTNALVVRDALPTGMAYVPGSFVLDTSALNGAITLNNVAPQTGSAFLDGVDVLFSFNDATVAADNDATNNTFSFTFQAVVLDVGTNVGYAPQTTLQNTASLTTSVITTAQAITGTPTVTVQEPKLAVQPTVTVNGSGNTGDAGDPVRYTTTVRHNDGSVTGADSTLAAYDVTYSDPLPSQFVPNSATSFTVTHSTEGDITSRFELVELTPGNWTLRTIAGQSFDLPLGATVTVVVDGALTSAVTPNQTITNNVSITYTNLDGDVTQTGGYNPSTQVDTDHERPYTASGSVNVRVPQASFTKSIVATGYTFTSGTNVAPTETVTYALRVTLPEGTTPNITIVDQLPAGMRYVSGTAQLVTTASASLGALANDFDGTVNTPTISVATGSGGDVTFTFGSISVTGDNVSNDNSFVILITAVVEDLPANEGILPGQTNLANTATFDISGDGVAVFTTPPVTVVVVEPQLTIDKVVLNGDTTVDAGTTINYRVTIRHTANSTATAFDVRLDDLLASIGLDLSVGSISITTPVGTTVVSNTSDASGLHVVFDQLALGATITVQYSAVLNGPEDVGFVIPQPGATVTNTATINYDDIPGTGGRTGNASDPASVTVNNNTISGYVYRDNNNNGLRDDGAGQAISGVRIELYDATTNTLIGFATTDANGFYQFTQLRPGSYYLVQPTQPTGLLDGRDTPGNVGSTFGGTVGGYFGTGTDSITNVVIPADSNTTEPNYNFGELAPASLGDFVWEDRNGNGRQDAGEPGLANVPVSLEWAGFDNAFGTADDQTFTTTTDSNGYYQFLNLRPNQYRLTFTAPNGYVFTVADSAAATDSTDSDVTNFVAGRTSAFTLAAGQSNQTLDAGLYRPVTIGDRVWQDRNANGVQDSGEPGVPNVTLTITWFGPDGASTGSDNVAFTATTDADGYYTIAGLPPGTYSVAVSTGTLPGGFVQTFDADGTGTANASTLTIASGETNLLQDFGYRGTGSLGDFVWQDLDADGVQDSGEPGIPGVTVQLTSAGADGTLGTADDLVYASTTTNAAGLYTFNNLLAGSYRVTIVTATLPSGAIQTFDRDGLGTANRADATLTAGQNRTDVDFGYRGTGAIGDFVWNDRDGDGVQEANEPGIPGVTVNLIGAGLDGALGTADDLFYASQTTDSTGAYRFGNLLTGLYRVDVVNASVPAGLTLTTANDPLDVTLGDGESYLTADFGYRGVGSIGDTVWFDQNNNGVQDAGEPGVANVDLVITWAGKNGILGDADDATYTARTDALGNYSLAGLPLGAYRVALDASDLPVGLTTPTFDFDGTGTPHVASTILLTAGDPDEDRADFGYRGTGSIGDYVWQDRDADGVQDSDEPALPGVTIELRGHGADGTPNTADDLVVTTTTDANGLYSFTNLPPGVYTVSVVTATLPGSATPTYDRDGIDTPHEATLSLNDGQNRTDVDFGYRGQGSIGDFLWQDRDADGVQDSGEPGIPGVTVNLIGAGLDGVLGTGDDLVFASTTTDEDGLYRFDYLVAGLYRVSVDATTLPGGATQTHDLNGALDHRADVTLAAAQNRTDVDFGYRGTASLGDYVWQDLDADGVQETGEPALPGVTVNLVEAGLDGVLGTSDDLVYASTTTDAAGLYAFGNLLAGTYRVSIDVASLPAGAIQTYDLDGVLDHAADATLAAGDAVTDLDFGYRGTGVIGDFVWNDRDADGVQDANEPGLAGITVQLTAAGLDGILGTGDDLTYTSRVTDSAGGYQFTNLLTGLYRVDVLDATVPDGLNLTTSNDPLDVDLGDGESYLTADFGYRGPGSIGDTVWFDQNRNGVQDAGEPGIANIDLTITWHGKDGVLGGGDDAVYTARTDSNGKYSLAGLPLGDYTVSLDFADLPTGLDVQTHDFDGLGTPHEAEVTLTAADADEDRADFGYRGTGSIGDYLWQDLDADGIQDAYEPALPGVTVELRGYGVDGQPNTADDLVVRTSTDANGLYSFEDLPPGVYSVTVITSTLPGGATPTYDLDGTGTPHVAELSLINGQNRTDVDFGYRGISTIGDFVWNDRDGDGVQDVNEPGIPGVTVQLTAAGLDGVLGTSDDLVYEPQVTGANGEYLFEYLVAGLYRVDVLDSSIPDGLSLTTSNDPLDVTLGAAQNYLAADFGYEGVGSIGDTVWFDMDSDGVRDAGEYGLQNVDLVITWYGKNGILGDADDVVYTARTDANGNYSLTGLPLGDFEVEVVTATLPNGVGLNIPTHDFDGLGTPSVAVVSLTAGDPDEDRADFGYRGVGLIGDKIFVDANLNRDFDDGEGIAGVVVTLTGDVDGDGDDETFTTVTDTNGTYLFPGLTEVEYTVTLDPTTLPPGVTPWLRPDGPGNTDYESRVTITVESPNRLDQDFGFRREGGTIGDTVFLDVNDDGAVDAGEGIANVTVTLTGDFDGDGDLDVLTTVTNDEGFYSFTGLPTVGTGPLAGPNGGVIYTVNVITATLPPTVSQTVDPDGAFDDASTVEITDVNPSYLDRDFGYRGTGGVRGSVYIDFNNNGRRQGEPGLANVPVSLLADFDGDGVYNNRVFTTTDKNGDYAFLGLPPGVVSIDEDRQPVQYTDGREALNDLPVPGRTSGGPDSIAGVTVIGGQIAVGNTFGELLIPELPIPAPTPDPFVPGLVRINRETITPFTPDFFRIRRDSDDLVDLERVGHYVEEYAGVAGVVYLDVNANGVKDAIEPGVAGVSIVLRGQTNRSTSTDKDGNYSFDYLPPGTYAIFERQPEGYVDGRLTIGTVGGKIGDESFTDIGLSAGVKGTQYNFGEEKAARLRGKVFFDVNQNGRQDIFEPGVPFVVVALGGTTDLGNQETRTAVTGWDGAYTFEDVRPGDYRVWQERPEFFLTSDNIPGNVGGENAGDAISGITLSQGTDARGYRFADRDLNLDAGARPALDWLQRGLRQATNALDPLWRRLGSTPGGPDVRETTQMPVPTDRGWMIFGDSGDDAVGEPLDAPTDASDAAMPPAGFVAGGAILAGAALASARGRAAKREKSAEWSSMLDAVLDDRG